MFPLLKREEENPLEIFQVWLNLPRASKMVKPHIGMLWSEDIPILRENDEEGKTTSVNIIAGDLKGIKALNPAPDSWAANPHNSVAIWTIRMQAGGQWLMPSAPGEANRTLYFYKGEGLRVDGEAITSYNLVEVDAGEEILLQAGSEDCYLLMLQGKPLNEPVAQYGPFVMNYQAEIQQAMLDYQRTEFGGWPWPRPDQVHGRNKGRFVLHADGREEIKQ
jgi:quercetin 2,3-dioxygenase